MNNDILRYNYRRIILIIALASMLTACGAPPRILYDEALQSGSTRQLTEFIEDNPTSVYAAKARTELARLVIGRADQMKSEETYREIIKQYPTNTMLVNMAKQRINSMALAKADSENTVEAYQLFMQNYPEPRYQTMAMARIDAIYYQKAEKANTIEAFKEYLIKSTNEQNKIKAKDKLAKMEFALAETTNTEDAYQRFINEYEDSEFAVTASERLLNMRLPGTLYFSDKGYVAVQWGKVKDFSSNMLTAAYGRSQNQVFNINDSTIICANNQTGLTTNKLTPNTNITIATLPEVNRRKAVAIFLGKAKIITVSRNNNEGETNENISYDLPACFPPLASKELSDPAIRP